MQANIQEWFNPNENVDYSPDFHDIPYISQSKTFKNFMIRANNYLSLSSKAQKKLILIEDLPSFATKKVEDFQQILKIQSRKFPLVIIQSEENKDLWTVDFLQENQIDIIHFNAITPTSISKVLTNIGQAEKVPIPDKNALQSLATSCNGDLRAAINAFQIGAVTKKYHKGVFEGNSTLGSSKKGGKTASSKAKNTTDRLAVIGGKDHNLDLFHAIGKVLYSKRTEELEKTHQFQLPSHKMRKNLQMNPEELIENLPLSGNAFTTFLHQSYPDFFSNIHALSAAAENMSLADSFFNEWTFTGKVALSDYGTLAAIRGLCYNNIGNQRNFSGMKTFHKPEWYSINKTCKQNNDILRHYFKQNYSMTEMALYLGPFYTEYFLPALNSNSDSITQACQFKDMPKKKISHKIERSQSDFTVNYEEDAISNLKPTVMMTADEADFLIEDSEEDDG